MPPADMFVCVFSTSDSTSRSLPKEVRHTVLLRPESLELQHFPLGVFQQCFLPRFLDHQHPNSPLSLLGISVLLRGFLLKYQNTKRTSAQVRSCCQTCHWLPHHKKAESISVRLSWGLVWSFEPWSTPLLTIRSPCPAPLARQGSQSGQPEKAVPWYVTAQRTDCRAG